MLNRQHTYDCPASDAQSMCGRPPNNINAALTCKTHTCTHSAYTQRAQPMTARAPPPPNPQVTQRRTVNCRKTRSGPSHLARTRAEERAPPGRGRTRAGREKRDRETAPKGGDGRPPPHPMGRGGGEPYDAKAIKRHPLRGVPAYGPNRRPPGVDTQASKRETAQLGND